MHTIKKLVKTVAPLRVQIAVRNFAQRRRIRGRPFPFIVSCPRSDVVLDCCVAFNQFGAYCVPVSGYHRPAALHVLAGEVWEAPTVEFMQSHCKNGDIVHAGTFFGDFLPALELSMSRDARLWAFEPHPESYRCAEITVHLNQLSKVALMNAGLGDSSGSHSPVTTDFNDRALGGASQMTPNSADDWVARGSRAVPVQIVAVDDVVPEHRPVSIIQLDIEGYEQRALTGALRTIRRCRPILIIETLPTEAWLSEYLSPLGYKITERMLENVILRCD
jgi:FkbM family methyltransferase